MSVKGVFLGGPGVGKSSIIKSYTDGHVEMFHRPTVSAAFVQQDCEFEGKKFEFGIWDTAGAEQYRSIAPIYFRSAHIAFVVADASDPRTDEDAIFWTQELLSKADENVVVVIVMNKIDLVQDLTEVEERAHALAAQYGDHYYMTSALSGRGVTELFEFGFDLIAPVFRSLSCNEAKDLDIKEKRTETDSGCTC